MERYTSVFPIILILLTLLEITLTQAQGRTLRDRMVSTSEEYGVPLWKAWDTWWQLQSCKQYILNMVLLDCNLKSYSSKPIAKYMEVQDATRPEPIEMSFEEVNPILE